MLRKLVQTGVITLLTGAAAAQESRPLPPVLVVTREELAASKARNEADLPPEPMDPEYKRLFDAYMARFDELELARQGEPLLLERADWLIDQLYEDMGHPGLNLRWQGLVVDDIRLGAQRPGTGDDVMDLLRNGLLNYVADGGGMSGPYSQMYLAHTLTILGDPAHPECDEEAARLCDHAEAWANELEAPWYFGAAQVEKFRNRIKKATERRSSLGARSGKTPADVEKAYLKADRMLRALSLGDRPTPELVERAARLATVDFGDAAVSEDMIARLLIAFRMTLEEGKRVPKRVVKTIDKKLLWLARDARKLSGRRHWRLWAEAVAALEIRASRDLRRYVYHDGPKKETDPVILEALEKAQRGLRRKPASLPPPRPTTSQPG